MTTPEAWRSLFEGWPKSIQRQGLLITSLNEAISFVEFMIGPGLLILERERPDTFGARKVILSYESINSLKITQVAELKQFQALGFRPPMNSQ